MDKASGWDGLTSARENQVFYLGIDVAKAKLDCMLLNSSTEKRKSKSVPNSPVGVTALLDWLDKQQATDVHVIMEPTGVYHEQAALALTDAGLKLSLVNPAKVRKYAEGIGIKNKTDKLDSAVLARYGAKELPELWQPPSASARTLQLLLTRRDAVAEDLQRENNRKELFEITSVPDVVRQSITASIEFLEKELARLQAQIEQHIDNDPDMRNKRDLLETIPGVGPRVSAHMTALLTGRTFERAEQLAAYLGLVPVMRQSGTSVKLRPHLSKAGPSRLRKLLYMPAVVAIQHNPHVKATYERLRAKGMVKMAALGAAMRKLAHLCFGVVHTGRAYDANLARLA